MYLAEATYSLRSRGSTVCASCVVVMSLLARFDQELCVHRQIQKKERERKIRDKIVNR